MNNVPEKAYDDEDEDVFNIGLERKREGVNVQMS